MKIPSYSRPISALGIAFLLLTGCFPETDDLGSFDAKGPFTEAQKAAIDNCLDVARRSANSFGYRAPKGTPHHVAPNGEQDFAITWKFDAEPKQYQCIVRKKTGEAYEYFWG
jgi:hypothetical protein